MSAIKSSLPTTSAPASSASLKFSGAVKTPIRISLPVPLGKTTVVLNCWSEYFGSINKLRWASTDSSNLAELISLTKERASSIE